MKFFRHRRPSWKTVLGVTGAKKRLKKQLGITQATKPLRMWSNQKRRLKRQLGYESSARRLLRNGLPRPGGCLVLLVCLGSTCAISVTWLAVCTVAAFADLTH